MSMIDDDWFDPWGFILTVIVVMLIILAYTFWR